MRKSMVVLVVMSALVVGASPASAVPMNQQPELHVGDVVVVEGQSDESTAVVPVTLSTAANKVVTVDFATTDGTAHAGSDYAPASGTLVFPRGSTSRTVLVTVNADDELEPDEVLFVTLANATNAVIGDGSGQVIIENDDMPPSHQLTVSVFGDGTVASDDGRIDCGTDCDERYVEGTVVTLHANPGAGSTFTGWTGGACAGSAQTTCTQTIDGDTHETATFAVDTPMMHTLTVTLSGIGGQFGRVTSNDGGIDCPADCEQSYPAATAVELTAHDGSAEPLFNVRLEEWHGACSGTNPTCTVTMTSNQAVDAQYTACMPCA